MSRMNWCAETIQAQRPILHLGLNESRLLSTCCVGAARRPGPAAPAGPSQHRTNIPSERGSPPSLFRGQSRSTFLQGKRPLLSVQVQAGKAGNLWRSRNLGREASEVVQGLKRAKGDPALAQIVIDEKLARLVRQDALLVLEQLQGQGKCDLALLVFRHIETESWYKPDDGILLPMLTCLIDGGHPALAHEFLQRCRTQYNWRPSLHVLQRLVGGYCQAGNVESAVAVLRDMAAQGGEATVLGVAFNSAIRLCQEQGLPSLALQLAEQREAGLKNEAAAAQEKE